MMKTFYLMAVIQSSVGDCYKIEAETEEEAKQEIEFGDPGEPFMSRNLNSKLVDFEKTNKDGDIL